MTAEQLSSIAGVILSLCMSYIPGVSDWYQKLSPVAKRAIMAALIIFVAAASYALSCAGVVKWVNCSNNGVGGLVSSVIAALVANQATHLISVSRQKRCSHNWFCDDPDAQLEAALRTLFTKEELLAVANDCGISIDVVDDTLSAIARRMVCYARGHGLLDSLRAAVLRARPNIIV
jgi:hypothetical protein